MQCTHRGVLVACDYTIYIFGTHTYSIAPLHGNSKRILEYYADRACFVTNNFFTILQNNIFNWRQYLHQPSNAGT